MDLETNLRQLVEQMLKQTAVEGRSAASISTIEPVLGKEELTADPGGIELLNSEIEPIQRHVRVSHPVNLNLYEKMQSATPARIGVGRAGSRPLTEVVLQFRADHALAQDAVLSEVSEDFIRGHHFIVVESMCRNKDEYITRPDLGRKLAPDNLEKIRRECQTEAQVQIIIGDGLSSKAIEANIPDLLPALMQGLTGMDIKTGTAIFVKYARVGVMDVIGEVLHPQVTVILIGERPGLGNAESMSAYIAYNARIGMIESERSVISNIHKGGIPAAEAGAHLASFIARVLQARASGTNLE